MNTPNNAAALECVLDEMGAFIEQEESPNLDTLENWHQRLRATLAQPDATRPRAIWPDAISSPERHQLRVLLECVDRRALSLHEADQLVNLIADALTSQPSGEASFEVFAREFGVNLTPYPASLPNLEGLRFKYAQANDAWKAWVASHPSADAPGQPSGEAVAWLIDAEYVDAGKVRAMSIGRPLTSHWPPNAVFTPLYTHPSADAPGVAVDEAWTLTEIRDAWNKAGEVGEPRSWFDLSAALRAALAPKPEGGHG